MAGEEGGLARYNAMINEMIPHFVGDIERLFVSVLKSIAKVDEVEQEDDAYNAVYKLTVNMSRRMRKRYWDHSVMCKIMQLRKGFVEFRRFIDLPYVGYDEDNNRVAVGADYFRMIHSRERAQHRIFREKGCQYYRNLKIIFVHRHFHLLMDEPSHLRWQDIPRRNGDQVPAVMGWLQPNDHDSDEDSDYPNEMDD